MHNVVISGTGLYTPANSISNEELVQSFNTYVRSSTPTTPMRSSAVRCRR